MILGSSAGYWFDPMAHELKTISYGPLEIQLKQQPVDVVTLPSSPEELIDWMALIRPMQSVNLKV